MEPEVTPFLMFEGKAEEAMEFYVRVIPDTRILSVDRYGPGEPGPEGSVRFASFSVRGQKVHCSDSFVKHNFTFTPSFSFFQQARDEEEITNLVAALSEEGLVLMPLDDHGFSRRFAWIQDRFGVSWQLNLA